MDILLLNTNPVVSRLVALCVRDDDVVLEEVSDISAVTMQKYDIAFVDDASYVGETRAFIENLMLKKRVYLSTKHVLDDAIEYFDEIIYKPFLPSQITAVLENFKEREEIKEIQEKSEEDAPKEEENEAFIFPLSSVKEDDLLEISEVDKHEKNEKPESLLELDEEQSKDGVPAEEAPESHPVLDSNEIERIKALLEEDEEEQSEDEKDEDNAVDYESRKVEVITEHLEADGLEIVSEEEMIDILSKKPKKKKSKNKKIEKEKKKKRKKKPNKEQEEIYTFEEALIAAIEGMKVKKIKKLLKNAEVSIRINFKDKK